MSLTVSLQGIKENPTLLADTITRGTDEGKPVKISANKTAALPSNGQAFVGIIESITHDNSVCVVRNHGLVTVAYSGSAPGLGWQPLVSDGAGKVKIGSSATPYYWVYDVDESQALVTFDLG